MIIEILNLILTLVSPFLAVVLYDFFKLNCWDWVLYKTGYSKRERMEEKVFKELEKRGGSLMSYQLGNIASEKEVEMAMRRLAVKGKVEVFREIEGMSHVTKYKNRWIIIGLNKHNF